MIAIQKVHSFSDALTYNDKKRHLDDVAKRAELLDHNFLDPNKDSVLKEIKMINQFNNRAKNDGYHVALSFSEYDNVNDDTLKAIADDYKKGMGFSDDHLFLLYKHNDEEDHKHIHMHLLIHRLAINPDNGKVEVVSDSNNYQRSEKLIRQLEIKYDLEKVIPSKEARDRAPNKNELEMIQRTGGESCKILMQEKVKEALNNSYTLADFIDSCKKVGVYLLFNQSETTGRVFGITYISSDDSFISKGQKLGNQYKWHNLIKDHINYEQSRDRQAIGETNRETRERFKSILNGGNGTSGRAPFPYNRETKGTTESSFEIGSENLKFGKEKYDSESRSGSKRVNGDKKAEQEVEQPHSNGFSDRYSTLISSSNGYFHPTPSDLDEEEAERKRKRKRKRRR